MAGAVDRAGQGSICLWRLAAHVSSAARIAAVLLGLDGEPWVLAIDRTNRGFGTAVPAQAGINIMIAVEWNGIGMPLV